MKTQDKITRSTPHCLCSLALLSMICICMTAVLGACAQRTVDSQTLATDSITIVQPGTDSLYFSAHYPTDSTALGRSIVEHLSEELGGTYTGSTAKPVDMLRHYANEMCAQMRTDSLQAINDLGRAWMQMRSIHINKVYETPNIVTFFIDQYVYAGGAHGNGTGKGLSFRKADGRLLGADLLIENTSPNDSLPSLRTLLKEGLKKHWNLKTDEELKEMTFGQDPAYIDLPQTPPYFTKDGLVFIYQSDEIAPHAAGAATIVLPYKQARHYLKFTARKLIE